MTKLRAPLTFERALTRVADRLGWERVAQIVSVRRRRPLSVRAVMNWSEPDTPAGITLEDAYLLDQAFRTDGGEGAPFHDCYRMRLETERGLSVAESDEFNRRVAAAIKEGGEANAARVIARRPNATPADRALARREVEESIQAQLGTLELLNEGLSLEKEAGRAAPMGGEAS